MAAREGFEPADAGSETRRRSAAYVRVRVRIPFVRRLEKEKSTSLSTDALWQREKDSKYEPVISKRFSPSLSSILRVIFAYLPC